MRLQATLENTRLHLKSIERERRRSRKERDRWIGKNALLEGWERGRDIGLYSGKVRMGYIYKSLRELEREER